jgi:hypothetical protein
MVAAGMLKSKGEVRRLIKGGGVYMNNAKVRLSYKSVPCLSVIIRDSSSMQNTATQGSPLCMQSAVAYTTPASPSTSVSTCQMRPSNCNNVVPPCFVLPYVLFNVSRAAVNCCAAGD